MKKTSLIILIIVLNVIFPLRYTYACDMIEMLSPEIVLGEGRLTGNILACYEAERILMNSSDENEWKQLLSFYVHEFADDGVPFLSRLVKKAKWRSPKKTIFKRAIVVAKEGRQLYAQKKDDLFVKFIDQIYQKTSNGYIKALDIGSGDGKFLRQVQSYPWARNVAFTGIDQSPDMIEASFYLNLMYVQRMNARGLAYPDREFGLVTLNYPNPAYGLRALRECMQEAYRVMIDGGGIVFTSCDNRKNGFPPELIIQELIFAGFNKESLKMFYKNRMPEAFPVVGTALQALDMKPYLILMCKDKLQKKKKNTEVLRNYSLTSLKILIEQAI